MATVLACAALALGVARTAMFVALHLVPSDYDIVHHAVSDYAVGPTRRLAAAMTWTSAVFWLALAAAVALAPANGGPGLAVWMLALAVVFALLPLLPTDVEGSAPTLVGRFHMLAAIAWFTIAYSCMGGFIRFFAPSAPGGLMALLVAVSWVAAVGLVALVPALVVRPLRRVAFGISERVFLLAVHVFYIAVAVGLVLV